MLRQALIFFLLFYSLWQGTVSLSDVSLAWAVFILFELFFFFGSLQLLWVCVTFSALLAPSEL